MSDKESLIENIVELTNKGNFSLQKFDFDEKNFGNFCIALTCNKQVNIRFIRDRGTVWCEAGRDGEWYLIEDVFRLIGTEFISEKSETIEFLSYMSGILMKNISKVMDVFDANNIADTHVKIKKIATERALEMFKTE
ncbi:hypothetical protein RBG61_00500 [Paludicola sp. MB14-C6]|uniref:hypothetical protein n=1 Tax=Paludihabitans sp. MB14-C6 TaxID=3070656 RepID=UPI0027DC276F|nr:hypothetical protein [Paludicola sp. MB14-C6]WMJ23170.1 hypothetical protein RBG61_00500 [Paludicola sp. MB14-C6]